jgi:hypothetical protein
MWIGRVRQDSDGLDGDVQMSGRWGMDESKMGFSFEARRRWVTARKSGGGDNGHGVIRMMA